MDRETQTAFLNALKEETGKDYFLQCEDGTVLASTCSLLGLFFREAADGRLPEEEIREKARRLKLDFSAGRYLLLLESEGLSAGLMEELTGALLPDALEAESCIAEASKGLLLLKKEAVPEPEEAVASIVSALEVETVSSVRVGVSRCFFDVGALPAARREAQMALTGLKRFPGSAQTAFFGELGMRRAVLEMKEEQCRAYLEGFPEALEQVLSDPELSRTAEVFLDTGLNSAETARQLIVHRNTLNYRLEKIQRLSGMDLKNFSDAAAFRLASLVWQNLKNTDRPYGRTGRKEEEANERTIL